MASQSVYKQIIKEGGHFYVCGDVSMAEDVCGTLKEILRDNGHTDPDSEIFNLKVQKEQSLHNQSLNHYLTFVFLFFSFVDTIILLYAEGDEIS